MIITKRFPALRDSEAVSRLFTPATEIADMPQVLAQLRVALLLASMLLLIACFVLCGDAKASAKPGPGNSCSSRAADAEQAGEAGFAPLDVAGCTNETTHSLLVIGFMGGRVSAGNLVHPEARIARLLQVGHPRSLHTLVFANHHASAALRSVLQFLDTNRDGILSTEEKQAARIVIYGHSWGASEAITLADRLNELGIPVLLTAQVDSVRKRGENDALIPPNVEEAINFYQAEGILHGRAKIFAANPDKTILLGDHESFYKRASISCSGYPWFARTFMKEHIEIENDPRVWNQITSLVQTFLTTESLASGAISAQGSAYRTLTVPERQDGIKVLNEASDPADQPIERAIP